MYSSFALDLRTARRRSGLSQSDCGHLLGVDQRRISQLEAGKALPNVPEICGLSLIFGRTFESLFSSVFIEMRTELQARLSTLPRTQKGWFARFNRHNTLSRIAAHLEAHSRFHD